MDHRNFINCWSNSEFPLSPITPFRLNRFGLSKKSFEFLTVAGLPTYAEPNLSFAIDTDDIVYGINKVTEQFDFEGDKNEYERYIVIGSCRDGDAIAIDINENDQIVELDHEDLFKPKFFNTTINSLAAFLILYRDFEDEVLLGKDPDDNFQCFNFSNNEFEKLTAKMLLADDKALTMDGFWKDELDIMLSLRREYFGKF